MKQIVLGVAVLATSLPLPAVAADPRPVVVDQLDVLQGLGGALEALARLEGVASARKLGSCALLVKDLRELRAALGELQGRVQSAQPIGFAGGWPMPPGLGAPAPPPPPEPPAPPPGPMPMASADLGRLLQHMEGESFEEGRFRILAQAVPHIWLSSDQVVLVLGKFQFGNSKLQALRLVAPRILDPENSFAIFPAFTFDAEKEQARQILSNRVP